VREVERENRKAVSLRHRHHTRIDEAEAEIRVLAVDLRGAAQQPGGEMRYGMLARRRRTEKHSARRSAKTRSNELIHLDENSVGNEELAAKEPDEVGGESVRRIAPIDSRNKRSRICDDSQRASMSSRRYSSARKLRSGGPSPAPT
jgi:hypothetical protein